MAETAKWNAVTSKFAFVWWYVLCLSSVFAFQLSKIDLWHLQFDLELWDDLAGNHQAVDAWRAWKRHFVSATGLEYCYSLYQLQFFSGIRHTVGFCAARAAAVWNFRAFGCPSPRGRAKDIAEWSQSRAKNMLSFAWAKPIGAWVSVCMRAPVDEIWRVPPPTRTNSCKRPLHGGRPSGSSSKPVHGSKLPKIQPQNSHLFNEKRQHTDMGWSLDGGNDPNEHPRCSCL